MSSKLPGILADIADIAGPDIAFRIAQSRGGTRIAIPPRAVPGHWLTELVGLEIADSICKGLATLDGDGRLQGIQREVIPLGPASYLRNARRKAAAALSAGTSVRETARIVGLHERTIWRMKARDDDDQGDLF